MKTPQDTSNRIPSDFQGPVAPSIQSVMKEKLEKAGLPYKKIEVYGRQIVVTTYGEETARRWFLLLANFAKVKGPLESLDLAKEQKGTNLNQSYVKVFRVFGTII